MNNFDYTDLNELTSLLSDIRDKLDENNDLLREISVKLDTNEATDYNADSLFWVFGEGRSEHSFYKLISCSIWRFWANFWSWVTSKIAPA